ncbi:MAG: ATP-binding protein [Brotaphodocola sp.]
MKNFRLWFLFTCAISMTFFFGFLVTGFMVFIGIQMDLISLSKPVHELPMIGTAIAAAIFSFSLTMVISRMFFHPIHELTKALKAVTSGDFNVHLLEQARWSDIREMNVNFNRMVKELNSIELLQSDFIQNVSHEIKTPLATVEGYASLLSASKLSEEQNEYVQRILESSRRLTALTGNILLLSKLENQQITPERRQFSLDEQLRCCILAMEPLWNKKELEMDVDLAEVSCLGNEDLLVQVWTNLLSNAIKYTPSGGTITIRLRKYKDTIQVIFQDSGIGMDQEVQSHIFDKFYQEDRSRSSGGNGLGLALVKRILLLCQGSIEVESQPGKGSSFTVRLP